MSYRLDQWLGWPIAASDGEIGRIKDVYFDDHRWTVRYWVVDTGDWLGGRRVLIPAITVQSIDRDEHVVHVRLNKQQVEALGLMPPVSNAPGKHGEAPIDPHLRSAKEVTGYHLHATHDPVGHIEDLLLDSASWAIRYLVVDTRNWLPGRHVVIPPQWIKSVDWTERVVNVEVARDVVEAAPEYHPDLEFSPAYAADLYRHYQRPTGGRPQ